MAAPKDEHVRSRFQRQKVRDTSVGLAIRRTVHATGLRYRVDTRPEPDMRTRADLLFSRAQDAVFIDGCFWHGCPEHFVPPVNNADWWSAKIDANMQRDTKTRAILRDRGWIVLQIWEHDDIAQAAAKIKDAVAR